jgi:hypothetical protein
MPLQRHDILPCVGCRKRWRNASRLSRIKTRSLANDNIIIVPTTDDNRLADLVGMKRINPVARLAVVMSVRAVVIE